MHYSVRLAAARHPARLPPQTMLEDTVLDLADLSATAENGVAWPIKACQRRLSTPDQIVDALGKRSRIRWRGDLVDALAETPPGVHSPLECVTSVMLSASTGYRAATVRSCQPRPAPAVPRCALLRVWRRRRTQRRLGAPHGVSPAGRAARQRAHAAGHQTLRYGWIPVAYHPCGVTLEVAHLLWQRGWRGVLRPCGTACPIATLKAPPALAGQFFGTNRNRDPTRR